MSHVIFESDGLIVATYCGPERADGEARTLWQFTLAGDDTAQGFTVLTREQAAALYFELHHSLAAMLAAPV